MTLSRLRVGKWYVPDADIFECVRVLREEESRQHAQIKFARDLLGAQPGDSLALVADAARLKLRAIAEQKGKSGE